MFMLYYSFGEGETDPLVEGMRRAEGAISAGACVFECLICDFIPMMYGFKIPPTFITNKNPPSSNYFSQLPSYTRNQTYHI